jgi:predicted NAD-dependent protein-ADP-ribosyltransferase YbiA (DUF1768 family)
MALVFRKKITERNLLLAVLFNDEKQAKEILMARDPLTMKLLGRKVHNFNDDVWLKRCVEIVKRGVLAKVIVYEPDNATRGPWATSLT